MSGFEVMMTTVGPVQENSFLIWREGTGKAIMIDPGEEPDRLMQPLAERNLELEAILLTHCHFDHIGAVAPIARATGAPVWCPELETQILADVMAYIPWDGIGPYESYDADHTVKGGEKLELAGIEFDVLFTPGHSPGHVTYSVPEAQLLFSGDVLFQGSVGRVDLPGGDWDTLLESIRGLVTSFPRETRVLPGHMDPTTLGDELETNPFLTELPT
ncbi:MAG: MBL fold metallo-hydrolase [Solirubrobacterales bacterium]|nr:MBL fold metallo-hydrolase [Solirubrobacterales bacterium]